MKPCEHPRPMSIFSRPRAAPSESARLGAKQGHAKSAKRDRFSALSFLKFRIPRVSASRNRGAHSAIPNRILPLRPLRAKARPGTAGREQSVSQSPITNLPSRPASAPRTLVGAWLPLRAKARPGTAGREQSGFSLTEVVIAMGVAAVAFTSIIALFPLGLNMSKESYEETQSALIAQTILADLKDQQVGSKNKRYTVAAGSPYSYKLIQIAGNVDPQIVTTNYLGVDTRLLTEQNVYLAYDVQPRKDTDTNSQPIMLRPSAGLLNTIPPWYSGTTISNGLAAVAKVTFVPTFSITTLAATTGVLRVDVSIETPGSAKPENRTVRLYTGAVVP